MRGGNDLVRPSIRWQKATLQPVFSPRGFDLRSIEVSANETIIFEEIVNSVLIWAVKKALTGPCKRPL